MANTKKVISRGRRRRSEEEKAFLEVREMVIEHFQKKGYNMIVRFGPFFPYSDDNAEISIIRGNTRWNFKGQWDVPQYDGSVLVVTLEGKENLSDEEYFTEDEWSELLEIIGMAFTAYPTSGHLSFFKEIGW